MIVEVSFTSTETVGLGMGVQDSHLDFHTAPGLSCDFKFCITFVHIKAELMLIRGLVNFTFINKDTQNLQNNQIKGVI